MKQRLWIISELFPPEETSTAYIMGQIANTFSHKYEVGVICGAEVYDKSRKQSTEGYSHGNYKIYRVESKTFNKNSIVGKALSFVTTSYLLYKLAKRLISTNDKVLMVTNPAPLVALISRLKTKRQFELNVLVHDVFPENLKAASLKLPFFNSIKKSFDKSFSRADRLIVIGRDMAEIMKAKTSGNVPVHIIENWGDFETVKPTHVPPKDKIIVEYAGNIGRVQGLETIATSLPNDVELHIYGSGAYENKLKKMNKPNIFFHGPYTRTEQSTVLGACHISIVTLNDRMYGLGVPSKTYNILASGRPIIYFGPKNSEVELLISEYNIGYCGWPKKWDFSELEEMGIKARKIGEANFSKEAILKKFTDLI
ncbi:MAG: glycosyltransferase family 4 protein [Muribaculaceae bacterium]|nr:glycosyltransferase family 4 protein [Muribaculaceae bacterium]